MASMVVMEDTAASEDMEDIVDSEVTEATGMASGAAVRLMIRTPKNSTTDTSEVTAATVAMEATVATEVTEVTATTVK